MTAVIQHSRILSKRATTTGVVPTVPASNDHTDGTWLATDIYKGELFFNLVDERFWTRFDSGIVELLDTSSISNAVYGVSWDGVTTIAPSKNAVYDELITLAKLDGTRAFTGALNVTGSFTSSTDNIIWQTSGGTNIFTITNGGLSVGLLTNAGLSATGSNNFFAGNGAGRESVDNYLNAYGTLALYQSVGSNKNALGPNAGYQSTGGSCNFIGPDSGLLATGANSNWIGPASGQQSSSSNSFGVGVYAGRLCTENNVAIFGEYTNFYFNYDEARSALGTSLTTVTLQTAKSEAGIDSSAATSILKFAAARGTGNAAPGNIVFQRAIVQASGTTRHTLEDATVFNGDTGTWSIKAGNSTGTIAKVGGVIHTNTTTTGNVGVGEDTLFSYSVPADTLNTNKDTIRFTITGTIASNVNAKRLRVKFGGTTIFDTGAAGIPISAAIDYVINGEIIRTGATTQKCSVYMNTNNATLASYADYTTAAETLSGAVTLSVTGEATADNDIVGEMFKVRWESSE